MKPPFNNSAAWLNSMLGKAYGLSAAYARGAVTLTLSEDDGSITAGDNQFREMRNGGPRAVWGERTYLIVASALGELGEPQEGDRITEIVGGESCVFEVAPGGNGEPAARWSDVERTVWRVNTKRVG
ncbi:MAG: hypothetical protein U0791_26510 [Gemmataceae bacterium]